MKIFGISDLHLSFSVANKSMDVFGSHWSDHWQKIASSWRESVAPDDIVLVSGDISWGLRPDEAKQDLLWLSELPGHIVLTRGNHDYWWQSIGKMRQAYPRLYFVQNDAVTIQGVSICGTRGWPLPGSEEFDDRDQKIYERELARLRLAVQALDSSAAYRIAMFHYPPLFYNQLDTEFTAILEENHIDLCVYGHIHQKCFEPQRFDLEHNQIRYRLISADYLNFAPKLLKII
ncbi:metallophosphoesterase [bacterium]|nr:metallophosphoesterase [bacterium]